MIADSAPKSLTGPTGGLFNMTGNLAGIVTPIVIGYIVEATGPFDRALVFVAAHCLLTIAAFFLAGPIRRLDAPAAAASSG